ncbi:MAG: aminotransferase class V-fold PLP-dependent enzyme, partial [Rhodopila sp.]
MPYSCNGWLVCTTSKVSITCRFKILSILVRNGEVEYINAATKVLYRWIEAEQNPQSWGRKYIGKGDEIVITWLEHHANIVPWQMLCEETGAKLRVAPVDDDRQVILEAYGALLNPRTKLVAFTQVSNALGTITPSTVMTAMAHAVGARVLLDGAQSVSHMRTDVQSIGCDWFVFSGHKIFAPTGIGALYGRTDVLEESPPWQGGGNMIKDVTFEHTDYHRPPTRFEAGTGNIAD